MSTRTRPHFEMADNPYLDNYPDAMLDVEKAHFLALALDMHETNIAVVRHVAFQSLLHTPTPEEFAETFYAESVPDVYAKEDVFERLCLDDPDADLSVKGLLQVISRERKDAERLYKFVSKSYDELEATRK